MLFEKIGLIKFPQDTVNWAKNSMLQPTPLLINENTIRVFCGMRDYEGKSRVGFVDLDSKNPTNVQNTSFKPCLDIGEPGMFDDNGVVPCAVLKIDNKVYLYYAGYFLGKNVRFIAFSGLAISEDNGETFQRFQSTPIFDRSEEGPLFRAIHCMLPVADKKWQVWYGAGGQFISGENKTLPNYNIKTLMTDDLTSFPLSGSSVVETQDDEYRVGRPFVVKGQAKYFMFFGAGSEKVPYSLELASSNDGMKWDRHENAIQFTNDDDDYDNEMKAYPSIITANETTYLFYNGNNYGYEGFICSKLVGKFE